MIALLLLACVTDAPPAAQAVTIRHAPVSAAALERVPVTDCRTCCIILRDGEDPMVYQGTYPLLGGDEDDLVSRQGDGYTATCAPCSCEP